MQGADARGEMMGKWSEYMQAEGVKNYEEYAAAEKAQASAPARDEALYIGRENKQPHRFVARWDSDMCSYCGEEHRAQPSEADTIAALIERYRLDREEGDMNACGVGEWVLHSAYYRDVAALRAELAEKDALLAKVRERLEAAGICKWLRDDIDAALRKGAQG